MDSPDHQPHQDAAGPAAAAGRRNRVAESDDRSQRILMMVLRAIFVVVLISVVVLTVASNRTGALDFGFSTVLGLVLSAVAVGLLVVTVDALTPNKRLAWVIGIFVGTLVGLVASVALGSVIDLVARSWDLKEHGEVYLSLGKVTLGIILVYLSISVVLTTRDDFRLVIPYVEFARQVRGTRPLLLDTSALVDGRIEDLGCTGIIDAPVIVAQFVIDELQSLADSGDPAKRARGRRGLEVLQRLRSNPWIDVEIEELRAEGRGVDRALVEAAKADRFRIVTTDSALERIAEISGVACLNLHAVAGALRPGQSAGDEFRIAVVRPGENPHQGVGFLEDGTMVVVDHGAGLVGATADVVVTNTVQTSAGRLVFARLAATSHEPLPGAPGAEGGSEESPTSEDDARRTSMARAATSQPRTPPRPGNDPTGRRGARNPRR